MRARQPSVPKTIGGAWTNCWVTVGRSQVVVLLRLGEVVHDCSDVLSTVAGGHEDDVRGVDDDRISQANSDYQPATGRVREQVARGKVLRSSDRHDAGWRRSPLSQRAVKGVPAAEVRPAHVGRHDAHATVD